MSFWESATTEQRLAQIDGGIECGMTSKQVALNCGAPIYTNGRDNAVIAFAALHGRHFSGTSAGARQRMSEAARHNLRKKNADRYGWDAANNVDVQIFDRPNNEHLFDFHPYDEGA